MLNSQIERIPVDYMKFDELHELVQKHGFEKVPMTEAAAAAAGADSCPAKKAAAASAAAGERGG
jgi:hypothetical protein